MPDRSVRSSLSADGDSTNAIAHVDEERMEAWVKIFVKEVRRCLRMQVSNKLQQARRDQSARTKSNKNDSKNESWGAKRDKVRMRWRRSGSGYKQAKQP